jgi:hypothetical protein
VQKVRKYLLIGVGILAIVYTYYQTSQPDAEKKSHASEQFREQARKAFDAISRCDDYRTKPAAYYEPRLLAAQAEVDSLRRQINGDAEHNIHTILFNYFLAVERTRADWVNFSATKKKELERDEQAKETAYLEAARNL